jgi:hypothetical protein
MRVTSQQTTNQAEIESRTFILMKLKLCSCTPQCMLATKDRAKRIYRHGPRHGTTAEPAI